MSMLFHISLRTSRSSNIYLEADSKDTVLSFLKAVTTAKVKNIKEVIYSKEYQIGVGKVGAFAPAPTDIQLKIMCKSKSFVLPIIIHFPKKGLKKEEVVKMVVGKMYLHNEVVESVLSVLVKKRKTK